MDRAALSPLLRSFERHLRAENRSEHTIAGRVDPLTCNEFQHLFAALVARPVEDPGHRLGWSGWRR
jgi:hypothetical protein